MNFIHSDSYMLEKVYGICEYDKLKQKSFVLRNIKVCIPIRNMTNPSSTVLNTIYDIFNLCLNDHKSDKQYSTLFEGFVFLKRGETVFL